jgi:hypothetical protein
VNPPHEIVLFQRPGSLIEHTDFQSYSFGSCPVNVASQPSPPRSGRVEWSGEIVASMRPNINEYCIQAIPLAKGRLEYHKDGESISEYQRVRVVRR